MHPHLRNIGIGGVALVLLAAFAPASHAAQADAGAPGEWLAQHTTARTLGLGGAFVGTADDALGVLWNPAGLTFMFQDALQLEDARLFGDASVQSLSFAVPGSWLPSFAATAVALKSGDFQRTNELNDPLGTFTTGQTAFLFTVAHGFTPRLGVGANVKVVRQTVEDFSGGGVGLDAGAIYQVTDKIRFGLSAQNVGGPKVTLRSVGETWPTTIRGGLSANVFSGRGLVAIELDHAGVSTKFHGGAEYWVQPMFALRAGYDGSEATGGMSYRFAPQYQVDYAFANTDLGVTHRFGLTWRFGGFFASSVADPQVFSPTGEHATTKIELNAHTKADADRWELAIVDKSGTVVRRFGGEGQPPAHLLWDGKDETGLPLADGVYHYHLEVRDRDGRLVASAARPIEISTGGPQGKVPVVASGHEEDGQ